MNWTFVLCNSEMDRVVKLRKREGPAWKRLNYIEIGIRESMIGSTMKKVLNGLKKKGKYTSVTFLSWFFVYGR